MLFNSVRATIGLICLLSTVYAAPFPFQATESSYDTRLGIGMHLQVRSHKHPLSAPARVQYHDQVDVHPGADKHFQVRFQLKAVPIDHQAVMDEMRRQISSLLFGDPLRNEHGNELIFLDSYAGGSDFFYRETGNALWKRAQLTMLSHTNHGPRFYIRFHDAIPHARYFLFSEHAIPPPDDIQKQISQALFYGDDSQTHELEFTNSYLDQDVEKREFLYCQTDRFEWKQETW